MDLRGLVLKEREGREWGEKRREGKRKGEGEGERNKNPPSDRSGYGPGSVATWVNDRGIFNDFFIANLLLSVMVKEF